jgi:tetratricopeptide (TPR) repeat protein
LLTQAIQADPDCADAHYNLALAYESLGQIEKVVAEYQEAIRADPDYADAHENLGSIYAQQGMMDEAIAKWQETLEIEPERASAHQNLGMAYAQQGKNDEAIAAFETYLQLAPPDDPARAQVESWIAELEGAAEGQGTEYRSAANGFSLDYPEGWVYSEDENQVLFASTEEELETGIPGNVFKVGLITGPLSQVAESAGLAEITDPVVALEIMAESMEMQIGPAETGTISDYPAALVPMTGSAQNVPYLGDLVVVLVDERIVTCVAFAPPDQWEDLRPIFLDMLNSLSFFEPSG